MARRGCPSRVSAPPRVPRLGWRRPPCRHSQTVCDDTRAGTCLACRVPGGRSQRCLPRSQRCLPSGIRAYALLGFACLFRARAVVSSYCRCRAWVCAWVCAWSCRHAVHFCALVCVCRACVCVYVRATGSYLTALSPLAGKCMTIRGATLRNTNGPRVGSSCVHVKQGTCKCLGWYVCSPCART